MFSKVGIFLTGLLIIFATALPGPAFAATDAKWADTEFSFNHGSGFQNYLLGTKIVRDSVHVLIVQYDFAKLGGAVGVVNLRYPSTAGVPGGAASAILPKNAVITGCIIDVLTAPTSGSSATIAIGTGQAANDLKTATAYGSYSGLVACVPVETAASAIKLTADRTPTLTIAGIAAPLTAGKINVLIKYMLSDP